MGKRKKKDGEPKPGTPEEQGEAVQPDAGEEWREKYLRTLADLDNFRKRTERDRDQMRRYAVEGLMRELLPVLDALEMACDADGDPADICKGVSIALGDALRAMADKGLEPIDAIGETFDPRFHEAVGMCADPEHPAGTIAVEERKGYRIHDRVLRPSRVHIVIAPPDPAPAESEPEPEPEGDD